jgi:hypothetical protein
LQTELSLEINDSMQNTRQKLLENFDHEVTERLKDSKDRSEKSRTRFEQILLRLSQAELGQQAVFDENGFELQQNPFPDLPIELGRYELPRRNPESYFYRLSDTLAQHLIRLAKQRTLEPKTLVFEYNTAPGKISVLEEQRGQSGWLRLAKYSVNALTQSEDHLILVGTDSTGTTLDTDWLEKLFLLKAQTLPSPEFAPQTLETLVRQAQQRTHQDISERNAQFFEQEAQRLDDWAEDLKIGLERELKDLDRQIKEARRAATAAISLTEKLEGQKQIKQLENSRNQKRRSLFEAQDKVDEQRGALIAELEGKLKQEANLEVLFTVQWKVV